MRNETEPAVAARLSKAEHPRGELTPAATVLYNPDPIILDALLSALDQGGRRIYVYINGEVTRGIDERLQKLANALVIRSAVNVGIGAALNALMEQASEDGFRHVLLLDQDSGPAPDLPEVLTARFETNDSEASPLAILSPLLVPPTEGNFLPIRYAWRDETVGAVQFAPTCGSLLSVAAWHAIGPFRADYFVGGIDIEWGFRAWSRGYASLVAKDIKLVHRWGTPARDGDANTPQILRQPPLRTYYYVRNAVDCLKLPYIPGRWRSKYALNLVAQILLLLHHNRYNKEMRKLLRAAIAAGIQGQLGAVPWPHVRDEHLDSRNA